MLAKGPRLKAMHESGLQARALGHFYFLVKLSDKGKEAPQPAQVLSWPPCLAKVSLSLFHISLRLC